MVDQHVEGISFVDDADVAASFAVDVEKRTITGTLIPWGKVARAGFSKWRFAQGSVHWSAEKRVKLNIGHERKETVGVGVRLQDTARGLSGSFRVAKGEQGDRALAQASDEILDGFSVEIDFEDGDGWTADPQDEGVRLVERVTLKGVALTGYPAFDDARVERVAAARHEGTTMEQDKQDMTAEGDEPAKFEQAITSLTERIDHLAEAQAAAAASMGDAVTAGFRSALEEMPAPQNGPQNVRAARFGTLVEPPVYRFNGTGDSLVRDAWAAARDRDDDAIDRLRKFRSQSEDLAATVTSAIQFAPQTTSTAAAIIPPGYRPDLYVTELTRGRPLVQLASRGTIDNATPFTVPKFTSSTSVTAAHVEGTNPSDGSVSLTTTTVTPAAKSGRLVLTREIVDSSNPAIDQIAFATMRESYARQTEADVYTLLNSTTLGAGGTITSGFVPSGAQASTTARGTGNRTLAAHVRDRLSQYPFARFNEITGAAMGQTAVGYLAAATDTAERPLFPWIGETNPSGVGPRQGGWLVDGVTFRGAWAMTGVAAGDSQIFLINSADLWVWESPLLTFRFEEKQGPANIELNVFGYFATHLLRPVGLSGIRIT